MTPKHVVKASRHFNRFVYLFFLFHGGFFAGNQLMVHHVAGALHADQMQLGILIGALYVGSMVMVLLIGELSERSSKRIGALIASLSYCVGAFFIVIAGNVPLAATAYFLYGCGTGALEGIMFSLIGDYNKEDTGKQMNLTQAAFSVGAVFSPIAIAWLLQHLSYKAVYGFICVFMAGIALMFLLDRSIDAFAVQSTSAAGGSTMFKLARVPLMLSLMILLMISTGSETALTYWLTNYFEMFGAAAMGAVGLSVYWFASIPGRLLASRVKNQSRSLIFSFLLCAVGVSLILLVPSPPLKLSGVLVTGIALSPVYPGISTLGGRLFPNHSAAAFSLMVFACGLGGTLAQPVISEVSKVASITVVYTAIVVIMLALALTSVFVSRALARKAADDGVA